MAAPSDVIHPLSPHNLPVFITAPGEADVFLIGAAIFLVFVLFLLGTLYFRLHALPEHLAHGNASKLQFEVVAVLALLALLTHTNWLWVAALLLALVPIPDLYGPLSAMAASLGRIAGWRKPVVDAAAQPPVTVDVEAGGGVPPPVPPDPAGGPEAAPAAGASRP